VEFAFAARYPAGTEEETRRTDGGTRARRFGEARHGTVAHGITRLPIEGSTVAQLRVHYRLNGGTRHTCPPMPIVRWATTAHVRSRRISQSRHLSPIWFMHLGLDEQSPQILPDAVHHLAVGLLGKIWSV